MSVALSELLDYLNASAEAPHACWAGMVLAPAALTQSGPVLAFCDRDGVDAARAVADSGARVVLVRPDVLERLAPDQERTLVACESPRLAFVRAVDRFWPEAATADALNGPAIVHPSARVHHSARIAAGASVGAGCEIDAGSVVLSGARLYRGTRLGKRVRVESNAVLGAPGFGFERDDGGRWRRFPQRGAVVLEDEVEVGAGACIDRGALGDTTIGAGTKVDDLAYVAHNVTTGRNCLLMAASLVCGSCRLGDGAVVSPGAKVREGCVIGEGAHVGLGAVVVSDVAPRTVVAGVPARFVRNGSYRE